MTKNENLFKKFSDDELYVINRALIESSYKFFMADTYSDDERKLHDYLLNMSTDERRRRDYTII